MVVFTIEFLSALFWSGSPTWLPLSSCSVMVSTIPHFILFSFCLPDSCARKTSPCGLRSQSAKLEGLSLNGQVSTLAPQSRSDIWWEGSFVSWYVSRCPHCGCPLTDEAASHCLNIYCVQWQWSIETVCYLWFCLWKLTEQRSVIHLPASLGRKGVDKAW